MITSCGSAVMRGRARREFVRASRRLVPRPAL